MDPLASEMLLLKAADQAETLEVGVSCAKVIAGDEPIDDGNDQKPTEKPTQKLTSPRSRQASTPKNRGGPVAEIKVLT